VLGTHVVVSESSRDLGVVIDRELSLTAHVTAVCQAGYNQQRQLRPVERSLSVYAKTLVQVLLSPGLLQLSGGSRIVLVLPKNLMTFFSRHTLNLTPLNLSPLPNLPFHVPYTVHLTKFTPLPTRIASKIFFSEGRFVRTQRTP